MKARQGNAVRFALPTKVCTNCTNRFVFARGYPPRHCELLLFVRALPRQLSASPAFFHCSGKGILNLLLKFIGPELTCPGDGLPCQEFRGAEEVRS